MLYKASNVHEFHRFEVGYIDIFASERGLNRQKKKQKHLISECVSSEIFNPNVLFGDDSIGLSQACTGRANDMNLAEWKRKKSVLHDLCSLKASSREIGFM